MECCCPEDGFWSLASDVANVIVAIASLALAFYIFVYQRGKDNLQVRLQWFKDLIIDPNKQKVYDFFDKIIEFSKQFNRPGLGDDEKAKFLNQLKEACDDFRKSFINLLSIVNRPMARDILHDLDETVDKITRNVDNPAIDLTSEVSFETNILWFIFKSRNYLFFRIFQYDGRRPKKLSLKKSR